MASAIRPHLAAFVFASLLFVAPALRAAVSGTVLSSGTQVLQHVPQGSKFTQIAAGERHKLALRSDGTVVAWGWNDYEQCQVPENLTGVIDIAAGRFHSLALRADGTVVSWGFAIGDRMLPPPDLSNVVAVEAGAEHSFALRRDGTLLAWGASDIVLHPGLKDLAQISVMDGFLIGIKTNRTVVAWRVNSPTLETVPAAVHGAVAVAAGRSDYMALKPDGTIVAWGATSGSVPSGLANVTALAGGAEFGLALRADGTIAEWGAIDFGLRFGPVPLREVKAIAAGYFDALALKADGSIVQWAVREVNLTPVPVSVSGVIAVSAGGLHSLALRQNGTVEAWGDNRFRQCWVPQDLNGVVAISAGAAHSLALKSDGTIVGWSWNGQRQPAESIAPPGLNEVTGISAGGKHSLALRADGTVAAWGDNALGQTNVPAGLSDVIAIAAGWEHSLALRRDGTVAAWGDNAHGQLSAPPGLSNLVAIAAGMWHSLGLKSDGTVVAWGAESYSGNPVNVPLGLRDVVAISANGGNSLAVRADGAVQIWGSQPHQPPARPPGAVRVLGASVGSSHSLVLYEMQPPSAPTIAVQPLSQSVQAGSTAVFQVQAQGEALEYQWRKNGTPIPGATLPVLTIANAQSGDAARYSVLVTNPQAPAGVPSDIAVLAVLPRAPIILAHPQGAAKLAGDSLILRVVAAGSEPFAYRWFRNGEALPGATNQTLEIASLELSDEGQYTVRVSNEAGSVLSGGAFLRVGPALSIPTRGEPGHVVSWGRYWIPNVEPHERFAAVAAGGAHMLAVKTDGTSIAWGSRAEVSTIRPPESLSNVVQIAAGDQHSIALLSNRTVVAGFPYHGYRTLASNALSIAAGSEWSLAAMLDGSVRVWDRLGSPLNVPAEVSGVVALAAGQAHALALKTNGTIMAWGANGDGQTQVPAGLNDAVAVAAGNFHSLALRRDGTVLAWGRNDQGQASVPAGLLNVKAIAAGLSQSLALREDGTVTAWGGTNSFLPAGLSNVSAISARNRWGLALGTDGRLTVWGVDDHSRKPYPLGASDLVSVSAGGPALALRANGTVFNWDRGLRGGDTVSPGLTGVVQVSAGTFHALALRGDGTVVQWGEQYYGSINGHVLKSVVPEGLGGVVAIDASREHNLALRANGTVAAWGQAFIGQQLRDAVVPAELAGVTAIAAGYDFNVALTFEGRVAAWGAWSLDSTNALQFGLRNAVAVDAGQTHGHAVLADGAVWAWRHADVGRAFPLAFLDNVVATSSSTGPIYSPNYAALRNDGFVVGWGFGAEPLGANGLPSDLARVTQISVGSDYSLALRRPAGFEFDPPGWLSGDTFGWTLIQPSGRATRFQASTNLIDWQDLGPAQSGSKILGSDPAAGRHRWRFYRALSD